MNRGKYNNSPIAIFYNYSGSVSCIFENSIEDLNFRAIQRCIKQISTKRKNSGEKRFEQLALFVQMGNLIRFYTVYDKISTTAFPFSYSILPANFKSFLCKGFPDTSLSGQIKNHFLPDTKRARRIFRVSSIVIKKIDSRSK